jgi:hypothetical protein
MNKVNLISLVLLLLFASPRAEGQTELDRLSDKIKSLVEAGEDGWTCKRGEPFGTQNALLESCHTSVPDRRIPSLTRHPRSVSIRVDVHDSAEEARRVLGSYAREHVGEYQPMNDLGDEAYGWGMDKADIVMRKGRFILWIHTNAWLDHDPDSQALRLDQRNARKKSERLRLTPKFAKHMIAALGSF